ncbi:MAG: toll/interleukin-1 receptor domain-containing protein [Clostridiales bacterium]|nr:toll/interleukin-1 receptor domain-containing protein [Clostridiales bacterium]
MILRHFFCIKTRGAFFTEGLKDGFVIVISGKMSGRIGRYIGNKMADNQKAMIYFGYEGEELRYANFAELPHTSVQNDFGRTELLNRFYNLKRDLKKIDLRGHPTIRNHSADHRSLLSEYNMVRMLINESLDIKHVDRNRTERNIFISYAPNDALFTYDLISDLDDYKYNVCGDSHELPPSKSLLESVTERCGIILFVLSRHTDRARLKADYTFLKKYAENNETSFNIVFILSDKQTAAPEYAMSVLDFSGKDGKRFNELLYVLSI